MLKEEDLLVEIDNVKKWISQYVEGSGAKGVVVGDSGGKDSAAVIALCSSALGKENVVAVSMPCHSIPTDFDDARLVAETFGVRFIKVDLTETYDEMEKKIRAGINKELSIDATINIKPRLRMTTLYGVAQTMNYLVAGTGNMCECAVGYTTKWGDSASDFNPLGNFTVDEVLKMGEFLGVPDKIIKKAPNDGLGGQTDEEKMGIKYSQIAEMIEYGNTEDETAKNEIIRRYKNSKHKRNLVPTYKLNTKNRDFSNIEKLL